MNYKKLNEKSKIIIKLRHPKVTLQKIPEARSHTSLSPIYYAITIADNKNKYDMTQGIMPRRNSTTLPSQGIRKATRYPTPRAVQVRLRG